MFSLLLALTLGTAFDDVVQAEMQSVRAIFPAPSHTAVVDGDWGAAATWGGSVPDSTSNVEIPLARTVTLKGDALAKKIFVKGKLIFSDEENTTLKVETLLSEAHSLVQIGTANEPLPPNITSTITFTPSDFANDPKRFSGGAVLMGEVKIFGTKKPWASFSVANKNSNTILFNSPLTNWAANDRIVIAGNKVGEHEVKTITGIAGLTVTLDSPLTFQHSPPPGLSMHAGNLTRNITFKSQSTIVQERAHLMLMHEPNIIIQGIAFKDMGRTDKSLPLTSYKFYENGQEFAAPNENEFNFPGRYPIHCHRQGFDNGVAKIDSCVVDGTIGWAAVNHSSNCDFVNNVIYNAYGAGYVSEAGDELGSFNNNLAIHITGLTANILDQNRIFLVDTGFSGSGQWYNGHNISSINNVSANCKSSGYTYWGKGFFQHALSGTYVDAKYLLDPSWAGPTQKMFGAFVNIREFRGNVSYGSQTGMDEWFMGRDATNPSRSPLDNFLAWGVNLGMLITYTGNTDINSPILIGNNPPGSSFGISIDSVSINVNVTNPNIKNFGITGISGSARGVNSIIGGIVESPNGTAIAIPNLNPISGTTVHDYNISDVNFGPLSKWYFTLPAKPTVTVPPKPYDVLGNIYYGGQRARYIEDAASFPGGNTPTKFKAWIGGSPVMP